MNRRYPIVDRPDSRAPPDRARLAALLAKGGQLLLPLLDLLEHGPAAVDDLIDVMGRAAIEAVPLMSAATVAGPKQQGERADRDIAYHGSQAGRLALRERQLRVTRPRLREKSPTPGEAGEVEVPAYEAMRKDGRLADRMLEILIDGLQLGGHHVICAVGVDAKGHKHVLGLREGATENAAVTTALLESRETRI
jgi:hypothetical protein